MKIKKYLFSIILLSVFGANSANAQSTMTDRQVLQYGKEALAAGKDQKTIASELVARGVTRAQAERVKKLYDAENGEITKLGGQDASRVHVTDQDAEQMDALAADDIINEAKVVQDSETIFGRNIFRRNSLNFAPSENLATPRNYILGPGDEVIIDIFGANQTTLRQTISPEGNINVDVLGPLYLNGMTIEEANTYLKKKLAAIYAGLNRHGSTDIRLSLGRIRTIQINIIGEVGNPGTYNLSSLATVFHALYRAGGVVGNGTMRNIVVTRNGRTVAKIDLYDFIMKGSRKNDIHLEDGDVILVKPYDILVDVKGKVKRPMRFEMKEGESLKSLLDYAGGFAQGAYTKNITVVRQNGRQYEVSSVDEFDYSTFKLQDGDEIEIGDLLSRFENRIKIEGAVYKTGLYQLGDVSSVRQLVEKADGPLPEAFLTRAVLHRERPDRTLEVMSIDLKGILDGSTPDVPLQNNDVLFVPSIYDIQEIGTVTINGEVVSGGTFPYADNMTIEDLVLQAGGLTEAASLARVDVTRRIRTKDAEKAGTHIAEHFALKMKQGFVIDGEPGFILQPYDIVTVRRAAGYETPRFVNVSGEANFTGSFPLVNKTMRLSELVQMAGGVTESAYTKGARLERRMTAEERKRLMALYKTMEHTGSNDTIEVSTLELGGTYYVGIDLDKAIANPGSTYDVVLKEGDVLNIPIFNNVVRISGAVIAPNNITYEEGKKAKWYIENAGGYADNARKRKVYAVEMNGHIKKIKRNTKIEPGSEIIIPQKVKRPSSLANILGIATTSASVATMLGTMYNIIKR